MSNAAATPVPQAKPMMSKLPVDGTIADEGSKEFQAAIQTLTYELRAIPKPLYLLWQVAVQLAIDK